MTVDASVSQNALTEQEVSLLLYLEDCAVSHGGTVNVSRISPDDMAVIEQWVDQDFIIFGTISAASLPDGAVRTHWCFLMSEAWNQVHAARRARAERLFSAKSWLPD